MNNEVRLQNLMDFTVKLIHPKTGNPIGTGIVISMDGKIITCAHVLRDAGIEPRKAKAKKVGVYFPQLNEGENNKKRKANVKTFLPKKEDDLVVLQLTDGSSPLAPEQIAQLGVAEGSEHHEFRSYGFSSIGEYLARYAEGKIMGPTEVAESELLVKPIELRTRDIRPGLSGAGVLDVEKNRIVGLITQRWNPAGETEDDNIGWATDTAVLTFSPFNFDLFTEPYPKREAPSPKTDITQAEASVFIKEKFSRNSAPAVLPEWTGRNDLLAQITADWNDPAKHVTGLIGFGGEGKSSLARKWVEQMSGYLEGIFWWGFYENRSIDEFLETALNFLSGGRIDPRQVPSSSLRAQIIGAMLGAGRYLFVLDGLEVLQHQDGDQYGLLQSADLRDLLTYFARPDNQSFCLITSRAPVLDLMDYITYTHRDVERLSEEDGVALLEKLGVKGGKEQKCNVVNDWDGHALTLSILAAYLVEHYEGDVIHLKSIPIPSTNEPRYERVYRVLRRYDEHLDKTEREFLKLFSAFRIPVRQSAFERVFVPVLNEVYETNNHSLSMIISRLVKYRLLTYDSFEKTFGIHPLIRGHYLALFENNPVQEKYVHNKIKDYYLSVAGSTPQFPTLDDLKSLIEGVHHACQATEYEEAWQLYIQRIQKMPSRLVLTDELSAYDLEITLLLQFFPFENAAQEIQIRDLGTRVWALNQLGYCLMCLGRLHEAEIFFNRAAESSIEGQVWSYASGIYTNLADLYIHLGKLDKSIEASGQAHELSRKKRISKLKPLAFQGTAYYLFGKLKPAGETFAKAEVLERKLNSSARYLYGLRGIQHANYLRRAGNIDGAHRITEANLQIVGRNHVTKDISMCHRVLGDLEFDLNNHKSARIHYESALKIARSISHRAVLIEALLARGRFYGKMPEVLETFGSAQSDLNEALNYAVESGYRIYEADIRVALGWAYLAEGKKDKARESAQRALQMSEEMKYHWGKVDAKEVLERIESS